MAELSDRAFTGLLSGSELPDQSRNREGGAGSAEMFTVPQYGE
jgi:hypothetical protein